MDLGALYGEAFLSDFDLRLVTADGRHELRRIPVHAAVLAGQSPYFKALLQNWTRAREITINVASAAEQDAAEAMLRCAYTGAAPPGAPPERLLATMVLADRYQLRGVAEACRAAILAADAARMSWGAALALLHLPPGLQEVDAFGGLADKAHERVWQDFHHLDAAFQRAPLRAAFLQLPRAAVERLVASDELRCVSENAVFLAVASWLRARVREARAAAAAGSAAGGGAAGGASSSGALAAIAAAPPAAPAAAGSSSSIGSGGGALATPVAAAECPSASGGDAAGGACFAAPAAVAADALDLLRLVRYPFCSANFLAAVAGHDQLLRLHPDFSTFLLEAAQHAMAPPAQRAAMAAGPRGARFRPRRRGGCGAAGGGGGPDPGGAAAGARAANSGGASASIVGGAGGGAAVGGGFGGGGGGFGGGGGASAAFTSYIARDDLQTAVAKFRASACRDAYYLLTEVTTGGARCCFGAKGGRGKGRPWPQRLGQYDPG